MVKLIFPILMGIIVLGLFRSGRLSLDLSGVLIAALVAILVVTTNDPVLIALAHLLSVVHPPFAIVGVAIGPSRHSNCISGHDQRYAERRWSYFDD